jgi:hypothetical protein
MELRIKPSNKNTWPLVGILIRGGTPAQWLLAMQEMGISLQSATVFPLPGTTANSVWGCLVATTVALEKTRIGKNEGCQLVHDLLYIPELSAVFPALTRAEPDQLFLSQKHIFHPDFGWVELSEPVDWAEMIRLPEVKEMSVRVPELPVFIPEKILTFQITPVSPEEVLESMDKEMTEQRKSLRETSLNMLEKARLSFYKLLFSSGKGEGTVQKNIAGLLGKFPSVTPELVQKWQQDFEDLEKRNQKNVDRLLDMFKNNPDEALKYAIPLDQGGASRGPSSGGVELDWAKRWLNFDLFGNSNTGGTTGGGAAVVADDDYQRLQAQYHQSAKELMDKEEYYKAAFIYLKLLKSYGIAAAVLEKGKYYKEAAAIYLKHEQNKPKAAECYEKGFMYKEAIDIYKELEDHEKVGDLYVLTNKRKEANRYYEKVVDKYRVGKQYVKAALIYKNKIGDASLGQSMLLEGWKSNADAYNCLNNYFSNIPEEKDLKTAIETVYAGQVNAANRATFLLILQQVFDKNDGLTAPIRAIAHEIIVEEIPTNFAIVSDLKHFQPKDKMVGKDALRFRFGKK